LGQVSVIAVSLPSNGNLYQWQEGNPTVLGDAINLTSNSYFNNSAGVSKVWYAPNSNYNGSDSFTFKANDGSLDSNIATVTITISGVNDAPVTSNQTASTNEDTAVEITLNSTNVEGDELTYSIVSDVSNGATSLSGSTVTYTPDANFNGTDSFTFKVNDGTEDSNTSTVTITIAAVNDAPTTNDVATTIDENRVIQGRLAGITLDGSDIDGDDLTYSLVTNPENGTATLSGSTLTYTANQDWNGVETFTYKANDGAVDSNTSTITVTVNAVNDTPVVTGEKMNGYSMRFTGNDNSYLDLPEISTNLGSPNSSFTTSMWVRKSTVNSDNYGVLMHANSGSNYFARLGIRGDNTVDYYHKGSGGDYSGATSTTINLDEWVHILYVSDHSIGMNKIYLNGTLAYSDTYNAGGDYVSAGRFWQLGNWTPRTVGNEHHHAFNGRMDEVAIWNVALSANEISSLYNDGNGKRADNIQASQLLVYYDFEEGNGTVLDQSGNGKNATINNAGHTTIVPFNPSSGATTDPISGGTLYVPGDYSTIGEALFNSSPGSTIYVEGGVYSTFNMVFDHNVKLISIDGPKSTILDFDTSPRLDNINFRGDTEDLTFEGTEINGFTIQGSRSRFLKVFNGQRVTFKNSIIRDNHMGGNESYPVVRLYGFAKFYDTTFSENSAGYSGAVIHLPENVSGSSEVDVSAYYNCIFENNTGYNSSTIHGSGNGGYIVEDSIFYENAANGPTNAVIQAGGGPGNTYTNVTFVDNDDYIISGNPSSGTHTFNNVISWNNTGFVNPNETDVTTYSVSNSIIEEGFATGTNIITSDPLFSDAANDDYTLTSGSPATTHSSTGSYVGAYDVTSSGSGQQGSSQTIVTNEDTAASIDLSSFASDVDGDTLTYSIVTDVSNGTTSLSGSIVTYTPAANYNGSDSFTWKVNDGTVDSAAGKVYITVNAVNDAPTIGDPITVNVSKSIGSANINTVSFQVDINDPDVSSPTDLLYYMIINDGGSGFQHHAYISSTWNSTYPTTLESEVHSNYGNNIEIWDQATQTFTYHAAVGHTGNETIKFYSRECESCSLSTDYFEVTIGIN
ncbi:MAG: tandem-95 repeat protein, partial [Candidatus Poseidoniales archaeon]